MIPVQNIYYMLSYAFQALQAQNYKDLATEKVHNTAELYAAILDKGISVQLKRGLGRDYLPKSESLSTLQGRLNISESIKTQTLLKKQMICTYDEFSTNTQFNQIIKSTMLMLLKANITNTRKKSLRNLLLFFSDVNEIDLRFANWNQHYNRSNQSYQLLLGICYLIYNGLLQTHNDGTTKIMDFLTNNVCAIYMKSFCLNTIVKNIQNYLPMPHRLHGNLMILRTNCFPKCKLILCCLRETIYLLSMQNIIHI